VINSRTAAPKGFGSIVAANERQRAGGSGGDVFDVRVVAFAGGSAATLQALQDLFGLDREGAQRLFDNVPLVVRRAAPANEAQSFVEALRSIGAQVALERPSNNNGDPAARGAEPMAMPRPAAPGARPPQPTAAKLAPPPPPKPVPGKAPPPPPRNLDVLPRPIMRAATADLEFDFAGPSGGDFDSEPRTSMQPSGAKKSGSRRNEIVFGDEPDTGTLELDIGAVRAATSERSGSRTTVSERAALVRTAIAERAASKAAQPQESLRAPEQPAAESRSEQFVGRVSNPDLARGGAGPMSRAAVVHKPGIDPKATPSRRRQIALLRILGAVAIAALGIQLDSSILWGNANVFSVLAHALAIHQLGVGVRGVAP
jgi:ribosomal protein L7/L12